VKEAIFFLLNTLFGLVILAFVLRLLLQMVRADFYNPISQAILRLTNPLVIPARRIIPSWGKIDMPTLIIIVLLQWAAVLALWGLQSAFYGTAFPGMLPLLLFALMELLRLILRFYFFALFVYALLSWIGPQGQNPIAALLTRLCEPLLRPVRQVIPPLGGLDLSVLVLLLGLQFLLIALR
jgi:YggT family protein